MSRPAASRRKQITLRAWRDLINAADQIGGEALDRVNAIEIASITVERNHRRWCAALGHRPYRLSVRTAALASALQTLRNPPLEPPASWLGSTSVRHDIALCYAMRELLTDQGRWTLEPVHLFDYADEI